MQVICDSCDEIYFNRIFDPDASRTSLNKKAFFFR